jgi:hypothetical protein
MLLACIELHTAQHIVCLQAHLRAVCMVFDGTDWKCQELQDNKQQLHLPAIGMMGDHLLCHSQGLY